MTWPNDIECPCGELIGDGEYENDEGLVWHPGCIAAVLEAEAANA